MQSSTPFRRPPCSCLSKPPVQLLHTCIAFWAIHLRACICAMHPSARCVERTSWVVEFWSAFNIAPEPGLPHACAQVVTLIVWCAGRFFLYTSYYSIFGALFGFTNFGRMLAIDNTVNGLFGLLQARAHAPPSQRAHGPLELLQAFCKHAPWLLRMSSAAGLRRMPVRSGWPHVDVGFDVPVRAAAAAADQLGPARAARQLHRHQHDPGVEPLAEMGAACPSCFRVRLLSWNTGLLPNRLTQRALCISSACPALQAPLTESAVSSVAIHGSGECGLAVASV